MRDMTKEAISWTPPAVADGAAIAHLKAALAGSRHWFVAMLEAMALWDKAEEIWDGCRYRYLIGGEAFDWMRLAERLCQAVDGQIPEEEKADLLFQGCPPVELSHHEWKRLLGPRKYSAYLNYVYGIMVEEALHMAVEDEVRKERLARGIGRESRILDEAYRRIYGYPFDEMLRRFRQDRALPPSERIELVEMKEFIYWLFKYRLRHCNRARVASDTRKGIKQLHLQRLALHSSRGDGREPAPIIGL